MSTNSRPYLLLFRNTGPENHAHLSEKERRDLIERWDAWYADLLKAGKATEGQPLKEDTRLITGARGSQVTDGPFPEAKEAIGGYVKILASSLDEATEIARRHPALDSGMQIELRQPTDTCHLGVCAH